ncbi:TPA: restriction endonuclease subunit S [Staphylococcus aureus]|nr:restriction endonuclease subunit S [Staphylococcus aureus]
MTNEVKNVPELRFPEFGGEWEEKSIGDLGSFYYGKSAPKWSITKDATIPCVRYGELYTKHKGIVKEIYSYTNIDSNNLRFSEGGEILVPRVGEDPMDFAKCSYLPFSGIAIGEMISVYNTSQNPIFITTYFNSQMKYEFAKRVEGASVSNLYYSYLTNINMKIPTINEQQKIGEFFSKLDRQIELEEQKLAKLEEQKKGYMQKIFSQELRFKDEKGNEYPEWEEKKLGDILERGNKDKVNEIGKYRRLTISLHGKGLYEVKQERKTKDTRPFYQRFEGELIIGKQNFFNGSIAIVTREFNGFICSNAIMSYKISNHMNRKYLLEYLLQNDFLRKNEYLADGTGQKELSEKKFEELEIKLPNSINEQQKIGVFLERLDNLIEKQSNKLELLKQRKKSFLQKMFV